MKKETFQNTPAEEIFCFSQAVKVGDWVWVAGTVSTDDDGNVLFEGDMAAQMRQTYANIRRTLEHFGASMADVVEDTMFVTNIAAANEAIGERHAAYAGTQPPASALIEVSGLALPSLVVEIKATQ